MLKTQQPQTLEWHDHEGFTPPKPKPNNKHDLQWCKLCGRLKLGVIIAPKPANGPTCGFHQWIEVLGFDLETGKVELHELPSDGKPEIVQPYFQTGESCPDCGHLFVKTGAGCGLCPNCGTTGGCS